jgi:AcrR family transcriptional regulator
VPRIIILIGGTQFLSKAMLRKQKSTGEPSGGDAVLGQRERNKRDKLQRIKNAARELFVTRGYDDTTTREIALRAGVGMGTVFTYADNKRDLLFLIANEDLEKTTGKSEAALSASASLMTNLMAVFRNHYEYFMRQPELSRLMLREMLFYDSGQQANRFKITREKVISLVSQSVRFAKDNGSIAGSGDDQLIGWVLFCVYQVELRSWLAGAELDLDAGLATLRRALTVCIVGLSAEKSALHLSR